MIIYKGHVIFEICIFFEHIDHTSYYYHVVFLPSNAYINTRMPHKLKIQGKTVKRNVLRVN